MILRRRCCGCQKKRGTVQAAGGWLCDSCCRDFGIFGSKLPNVSAANSRKYQTEVLCKRRHNQVRIQRYRSGGKNWEKGTCVRCGVVVYDAVCS